MTDTFVNDSLMELALIAAVLAIVSLVIAIKGRL